MTHFIWAAGRTSPRNCRSAVHRYVLINRKIAVLVAGADELLRQQAPLERLAFPAKQYSIVLLRAFSKDGEVACLHHDVVRSRIGRERQHQQKLGLHAHRNLCLNLKWHHSMTATTSRSRRAIRLSTCTQRRGEWAAGRFSANRTLKSVLAFRPKQNSQIQHNGNHTA